MPIGAPTLYLARAQYCAGMRTTTAQSLDGCAGAKVDGWQSLAHFTWPHSFAHKALSKTQLPSIVHTPTLGITVA